MKLFGKIHFDRELTYSKSTKLNEILQKTKGLMIALDGLGIHWDGHTNLEKPENTLLEVMNFLDNYNIRCMGIMHIEKDGEKLYDIVVIKNRVKIYRNGKIENIKNNI